MTNRILLIYNPMAGKGLFLSRLPEVIDVFTKAGFSVEAYPTQAPGDAVKKICSLSGDYNMVVPAGGDGTLDEVVTGLVRSGRENIPIGYIPVGSTNDYASSLGLSGNILEDVGEIIAGEPYGVDVGILNEDHVFVYVAAFGAFTEVAYETDQGRKNTLGHVAYLLEGAKRLGDLKSYMMRVTVDGRTFQQDYIYGMITNSTSVGGMKNLTGKPADILLDDGLFEVTLIHTPRNVIELQEIIGTLMMPSRESELVDTFTTSSIRLQSMKDIPWTLDGEYGGTYTEVSITNRKKAVKIMLENHSATIS